MKTEELTKAKKYIEHVIGTIKHDGHLGRIQTDWIFPDLEKALAAIGGMMNNKRISEIVEEEMIKQDANRYRDMRKILTIPKSIADLLDKFIEFYFDDVGHEDWWIQENGLIEWFSKTPNCYIKDAYLAGKALGVDLVKVGEG